MYYVQKTLEISAAHQLRLDYESKCENLHGHNYMITVYCKSETLDRNGMVVDFNVIKEKVHNYLDHKNLNDLFTFNTTGENLAKWVVDTVPNCYKCDVEETKNNIATYEVD